MEDVIVSMGLAVLFDLLKKMNPAKQAVLKKAMLKLRNAINLRYAGDPDFQ